MNTRAQVLVLSTLVAFASLTAARAAEAPPIHPAIQAAVDSPERPEKDRARDESRHYAELLEFFGVRPGMTVLALKPGGWFAVVEHVAPAGTGAEQARDRDHGTHRIDEEYVKKIFAEAGFMLEDHNDALRNPDDDRIKPFFAPEMRGRQTDRFVLKFIKK